MESAAHPVSVSVITPTRAQPSRMGLLTDLHRDLAASTTSWEWVLAVDGDDAPPLPDDLVHDPRVRVLRVGRQVGAAAARNLALGIARGDFITCVDDDDSLPQGSLEVRLEAARSGMPWVAALLADEDHGATRVWDSPIARGVLQPGDVWRAWACPCLPFPIGPTTLLVEARLLRSVGGWQGLPQAEDFGMALAVTSRAPGMMLDDVVYVYHKHPGQSMRRHDFDDLEPLVRHITFERGRLLAEARWAAPAIVLQHKETLRGAEHTARRTPSLLRHGGTQVTPVA